MNFIIALLLSLLPQIDEEIPEGAFTYPGLHPREIIVLDPDRSPLLKQGYFQLKSQLHLEWTEKKVLQSVLTFVKTTLFNPDTCSERKTVQLIHELYPDEFQPEIPLETFIEEKTGVCRHIALATTYYLHELAKDGWLEGTAYLIRDEIPLGRHAWTLFLSNESAWHLDAYWGLLEDGKTEEGYKKLSRFYGVETMKRQAQRWTDGD